LPLTIPIANKRKCKARATPQLKPSESLLRNATDSKVCKSCRKPELSHGEQKDREARLLNIIRHQIGRSGLDPFLESCLLLDAPELLQEINESTGKVHVMSHRSDVCVPATSTAQAVPDSESSSITHGAQDLAFDATAKEVAHHAGTDLSPPPFEQVPFTGGFSDEQFEEMVRSMKADGIYPPSPPHPLQDASLDG
jgi:hypothetical protein